jgi:hypothetical protein
LCVICSRCVDNLINHNNFNKLLDGTVVFSSVIIGFLGVVLAILLSIRNDEIVKYIFNRKERTLLLEYFNHALISGFATIVITISLYFQNSIYRLQIGHFYIGNVPFYLWVFIIVFFIVSAARIIMIIMDIVFLPTKDEKKQGSVKLNQNKSNDLRNKYKQ